MKRLLNGRDPHETPEVGDQFGLDNGRIRWVVEINGDDITYFDRESRKTVKRSEFLRWIKSAIVFKRRDVQCGTCLLFSPIPYLSLEGVCLWRVQIETPPHVKIEYGSRVNRDDGGNCFCWQKASATELAARKGSEG